MPSFYFLVEGSKDKRFFDGVIKPILEEAFDEVKTIETSKWKKEKIRSIIRSFESMGAKYLFVADLDETPCVTKKKEKILNQYHNIDEERIVVVKKEIESWYLAGLSEGVCKELKVAYLKDTQIIHKEKFEEMAPPSFDSIVKFMAEITKKYCLKSAKERNASFEHFYKKHIEGIGLGAATQLI